MSALCPDNRCDGSGFLWDEERRRAQPCSCRPARMARKRAGAVAGRLPKRFREVSFEREPVASMNDALMREVRTYVRAIAQRLDEGRGIWFIGDVGTGKTTLAMLISKAAMEADRTVAIYSLPRLLALLRETYDDDAQFSLNELIDRLCAVDLLHIDDVGAEQSSAWVLEQLYTIVNTRYEDGKALRAHDQPRPGGAGRRRSGRAPCRGSTRSAAMPLPMHGADHRVPQHMRVEGPVRGRGRHLGGRRAVPVRTTPLD